MNSLVDNTYTLNQAWLRAVKAGDLERLKQLHIVGVDVDQPLPEIGGGTALVYASSKCGEDIYRWLLDVGADISKTNGLNMNVLHWEHHLSVVQLFVEKGANINQQDISGQTPLFHVKNAEVLRYLIENGADLSIKDSIGLTAFDHAKMLKYNEDLMNVYLNQFTLQEKHKLDQTTPSIISLRQSPRL